MVEHGWVVSPLSAAVPGSFCLRCASALRMLAWFVRCVECGDTIESESARGGIRLALLPGLARPAPAPLRALQRARPPGAGQPRRDLGPPRRPVEPRPGRVQRRTARAEVHGTVSRCGLLVSLLVGALALIVAPERLGPRHCGRVAAHGRRRDAVQLHVPALAGQRERRASWSVSSGALPPGLRLSSNDRSATVYGTPTQPGSYRFYLKVRDTPGPWVCCTEEEFTINVIEGLSIANGALPSGHVGDQYGYQLSTSGGTASSWSVAGGSLPSGLTLDPSGAITGMPTQTVSASFTVRASDGSRATTKQFTLYVVDPLVLTALRRQRRSSSVDRSSSPSRQREGLRRTAGARSRSPRAST